jgi:HD-like signal output (HDOD) protein
MLQLFKRLFKREQPPVVEAKVAPASTPKLSRGTPAVQPVASDLPPPPKTPSTPFLLFTGPESLRPRQIDPARVLEMGATLLEQLRSSDVVLPPSPVMALRVSVFLKKGDPDINELVRLIGQDPSMSAKVLQVANSAMYSPTRPLDTVRAAVTQMGTKAVSALVLGEATRSMFDPGARAMSESYRQLAGRLFHDAATSSHLAGALAISSNKGRIDRVFLGGMLHDLGKPLALRLLASQEREALAPDMLEAVLEAVHVDAGRELMRRWELPDGLVALCEHHHDETVEPGEDGDDLHVVRVASGVIAHLRGAAPGDLHAQVLHSMNALKLTPDHTRVLVTDAREASRVVAASYGLDGHAFAPTAAPATPQVRGTDTRTSAR